MKVICIESREGHSFFVDECPVFTYSPLFKGLIEAAAGAVEATTLQDDETSSIAPIQVRDLGTRCLEETIRFFYWKQQHRDQVVEKIPEFETLATKQPRLAQEMLIGANFLGC
jgi:hypothetical protein